MDNLFSKGGIYKGSSLLITGTAGTSKTILAAYFAIGSCMRKEKVLYFSFEESANQLVRNMATVGIDMQPFLDDGSLTIHASRPSLQGLEMHLLILHRFLKELKPDTVVVDPISSLITVGTPSEVRAMLVRLMDVLQVSEINALFSSLSTHDNWNYTDETLDAISSLADTWIELKNSPTEGQRRRSLMIVKSRGMGHYNNPLEFHITNNGVVLEKKISTI